jgi:hypothetical protein
MTSYDAAKEELAKLAPTRPASELRALIEGVKTDPRSGGCVMLRGSTEMRCPRLTTWRAEMARAERRQKAQGELAKAIAPPQANSDAVALTGYLQTLGIEVSIDRLNKLLVLLAVLVVECGGGMALAVGMSLSGVGERAPNSRMSTAHAVAARHGRERMDTSRDANKVTPSRPQQQLDTAVQPGLDATDKTTADVRLLSYLQEKGGVLVSSQGALARALGWSKWWCHVVLHDLAAAGLVKLTTAKTASVVRLIPIGSRLVAEPEGDELLKQLLVLHAGVLG